MAQESNQQDRLLDLIFGLLPDDEAEQLRAEIEQDDALAKAFAEAQAIAGLMGEAARLQSPRIPLTRPEPNGAAAYAAPIQEPSTESAPWSRWAQWGLVAAASILILASLAGWTRHRSQLANAGGDQLRLQVTGPSLIENTVDNKYSITTTTAAGRPVSTNVHFSVCAADGTQILGHTQKTGEDGSLRVELPADPQLQDAAQIKFEAGKEDDRQSVESRILVRREGISTHLRLDRTQYAPGDTVHFRSVSLSRFHLVPDRPLPIHFEIVDPQGQTVLGSSCQATTDQGVADGEFDLPDDIQGGVFTLAARSSDSRFPEAQTEFLVHTFRDTSIQKELEFSGTNFGPGTEVIAAFRATRRDGTPVADAAVEVTAKVGDQAVHHNSAKTDADGNVAVNFRLPDRIGDPNVVLVISVDDGSVRETLVEPVPLGQGPITVDFFPEGGDLAPVGENRVYFTARDSRGLPVELSGRIVDDSGNTYALAKTIHDGRGMFRFSPRVGVRYRLLPETPADAEVDGELPYVMPTQKIVINAGVGIFEAGKPIEFNVRASEAQLPLVAMASCRGVHVGEQAFLTKPTNNGDEKAVANAVAISLPADAAGVIRLTVFDYSVSPPRPIAERLVYRKPQERLQVALATDRDTYEPGASGRITASVTDEHGRPVQALLGLSVVDESVLRKESFSPSTMTTHFWLLSEIKDPGDLEDANFLLEDKPEAETALDLLLGTQGWRRFAERPGLVDREIDANTRPEKQLASLGTVTTPPLMLDNLPSLTASTSQNSDGTADRGFLLGSLIVLGGAGLLVFVTMLTLLRVAGGLRIWAPTIGAVTVSFLLVFLMLSPDRPTTRAIAFQSYRPPVTSTTAQTQQSESLEELLDTERYEPNDVPLEPPHAEPATEGKPADSRDDDRMEGGTDNRTLEEMPRLDAASGLAPDRPEGGSTGAPKSESAPAIMPTSPAPEPESSETKNGELRDRSEPASSPDDSALNAEKRDGLEEEDLEGVRKSPKSELLPKDAAEPRDNMTLARDLGTRNRTESDFLFGDRMVRQYDADSFARGVRRNVAKTALWAPLLETDKQGEAVADFVLSDTPTRYRAVADAHGAGRIGSAIETVRSELPFHVSTDWPAELTLGDRIELPVTITDEASDRKDVRLSVEAPDVLAFDGPTDIAVSLKNENRIRQYLSATTVAPADRAVIRVRGQTDSHEDTIERTLRVEPTGYPRTTSISGILTGKHELTFDIPEDAVPESIAASVTLFPSVVAELQSGLDSTSDNGFDATVATVVVADMLLDQMRRNGVADPEMIRLARERRSNALRRLQIFYTAEGGYARFENGPPDIESTAMAMLALGMEREILGVRSRTIDVTAGWLLKKLDTESAPIEKVAEVPTAWWWAAWAIAKTFPQDQNFALDLVSVEVLESGNADKMALAAIVAARLSQTDMEDKLLNRLAELQSEDGRVTCEDLPDPEVTALAVQAWCSRHDEFAAPVSKAVLWLASQRKHNGSFGSPRATALALQALTDADLEAPRSVTNGTVTVRKGQKALAEYNIKGSSSRPVVLGGLGSHLKTGANELVLQFEDEVSLPYTAAISYYRPVCPSENLPLKLRTELEKAKTREGQTVRLKISLHNTAEHTLASPTAEIGLPAGLEIAPSLLKAEKRAGRIVAYQTRSRRMILSWQSLSPGQQVNVALEATVIVPGEFTGPASSAYLSQTPEVRSWAPPLTIAVEPAE